MGEFNITKNVGISKSDTDEFDPGNNILPDFFSVTMEDEVSEGYTDQTIYLKINLKNNSNKEFTRLIYLDAPLSGFVELFDGSKKYKSGSSVPLSKRSLKSILPVFEVSLFPHTEKSFYIKMKSIHKISFKVILSDEETYRDMRSSRADIYKFYSGAILALFLYNLFIAVVFKNKRYYIYCLFALSFFSVTIIVNGMSDYFDIFETTTISHYLILFSSVTVISALLFGRSYIQFDKYFNTNKYTNVYRLLLCAHSIPLIAFFTPWFEDLIRPLGQLNEVIILISLCFLVFVGLVGVKNKNDLAKVYVLSWSLVLGGIVIHVLSTSGFIETNIITSHSVLLGSLFEMLALSLGLGYQITILDKQKEEAKLLAQDMDKYQKLLRVISHDVSNSLQVIELCVGRYRRVMSDDKTKKFFDRIHVASQNIGDILRHVKQEQKIKDQKSNLILASVGLNDVVNHCITIFEEKMIDKHLTLSIDISVDADSVIAEKVTLINNVLGNIISNAIKFSPKGGKIKISSKNTDDSIELIIKDEGKGFAQNELEQYRKESTITSSTIGTSGEKGTGFGMQIILSYMNLYDGTLALRNRGGAEYALTFKRSLTN